jgi:hypothetical protein
MPSALDLDLKRIRAQAFDRADWAEAVVRRYHTVIAKLDGSTIQTIRALYDWMFIPTTLWPFNIQDVLEDCLSVLEKAKRLTSRHRLIIELLPEPPDDAICAAVTGHEFQVQKGTYENLVKTQAKYAQNELAIKSDPELQRHWAAIKSAFAVQAYRDYKGVIRRTMTAERNLRPSFSVDMKQPHDVFHAAFDAFCLRWNLYGMQHDEPLLLKLAVNLTPYGTMIHIPAYWSFDPKRDIRWDAIARLHRTRVHGRQGSALAEGVAERIQNAAKLHQLDQEVRRIGLKGDPKHEFICRGLGWDVRTSPKRISRLRAEFKNRPALKVSPLPTD